MVFDSASVLPDPDEGSDPLTYQYPASPYSHQPRKKQAKRVRFFDNSVVPGFRYEFGYPPLKDRSVEWKDRGCTHKYMMKLWQERIRDSSDPKFVKERDFCFSLGQDWGQDCFWFLDVDSVWYKKQALPEFPSFSFC